MTIELSDDERQLLIGSLRRLLEASWPVEKAVDLANDATRVAAVLGSTSAT